MSAAFTIKICGVTSAEDAALVADAGADAVGVNLWPGSKRFVDATRARAVVRAIPRGVLKIGVFVDATRAEIDAAMAALELDLAQLHGDEPAAAFHDFPAGKLIRAIRVRDAASLAAAAGWTPRVFLYDADAPGYGGGGVPAPWPVIAGGARRPFWLAGGLSSDNVGRAIAAVRPDGVDVASGVEAAPGRKDPEQVKAFVRAARAAYMAG